MTKELVDVVQYEVDDGIATIILNRPADRNSVNLDVCDALYEAMGRFEADPAARVAILTGVGKVFCAGADLKAFGSGDGPKIAAHPGGFGGFVRFPRTKPVIAAVNGHALAGGLELVLAADLAVASDEALFGVPEVTVGLMAGGGGAIRLPIELPAKIGLRMLLTGEPIRAVEALRWGLVTDVVERALVIPAAVAMAREIAAASPSAVAATLRVARAAMMLRDEGSAWCVSDDVMAEVFDTADAREGVLAFAEKRPPRWERR